MMRQNGLTSLPDMKNDLKKEGNMLPE